MNICKVHVYLYLDLDSKMILVTPCMVQPFSALALHNEPGD